VTAGAARLPDGAKRPRPGGDGLRSRIGRSESDSRAIAQAFGTGVSCCEPIRRRSCLELAVSLRERLRPGG
jgi:hypothetical protein